MRTRTADTLVGLLVIGAALVSVAALVVTRGWTERRITIYMLSPTVKDLKEDTPVYLQGLAIGEVSAISPKVDTGSAGLVEFLVVLRLRERYANGLLIRIPVGTHGAISSTGLIGAASIALEIPPGPSATALVPGDTIRGEVTQGWTDVLKEVADSLKTQTSDILRETRALLATLDRTATTAQSELAQTGPELRAALSSTRRLLDRLEPVIDQARSTLTQADTRVGSLSDSLTRLLADTRKLVNHADTLTTTVTGLSNDIAPDVRRTLDNLFVVSAKLDRFIDQVSRRPTRLMTGVHQPPRDSIIGQAQ